MMSRNIHLGCDSPADQETDSGSKNVTRWSVLESSVLIWGMNMKVLASQSCPTLCNPMDRAHQAPLSMGFSRQECWSGLPFSHPGIVPTQESNPYPFPIEPLNNLPTWTRGNPDTEAEGPSQGQPLGDDGEMVAWAQTSGEIRMLAVRLMEF